MFKLKWLSVWLLFLPNHCRFAPKSISFVPIESLSSHLGTSFWMHASSFWLSYCGNRTLPATNTLTSPRCKKTVSPIVTCVYEIPMKSISHTFGFGKLTSKHFIVSSRLSGFLCARQGSLWSIFFSSDGVLHSSTTRSRGPHL